MADGWQGYQEETAAFFRALGLEADTNVRVQGARTHHMVDVVVRFQHTGFDILWLIECKHWRTRVSKLHVLALREIVADVGADRGILLSESGFQEGAIEAAALTSVRTTSLATLRVTASDEIKAVRLRELYDRNQLCKRRYWDIAKDERIRRGLRPDVGVYGYSGARTTELAEEVLAKALRGVYPFECQSLSSSVAFGESRQFVSSGDVLEALEPMVRELEALLDSGDATSERADG